MTKVAINGFGRIGRLAFKVLLEKGVDVVAINDLTDNKTLAHLLKYDSVHGKFNGAVSFDDESLTVNGKRIQALAEPNPTKLPWADLGVDVVLESTGRFTQKEDAEQHVTAGAKKVVISAPGKGDLKTIVLGVNDDILDGSETVVSNASCTTNCLTLILAPIHQALGIEEAAITTVHAWTADQNLVDGWHSIPRRERAAPNAIVPTSSGAAEGVMQVMPELRGKLSAHSLRVPVNNMSLAEVTLIAEQGVTTDRLREVLANASVLQPQLLGVSTEPLVSCDFIRDPRSAIVDEEMTQAHGRLLKVLAWHDNEWAYACRMLDTAALMAAQF